MTGVVTWKQDSRKEGYWKQEKSKLNLTSYALAPIQRVSVYRLFSILSVLKFIIKGFLLNICRPGQEDILINTNEKSSLSDWMRCKICMNWMTCPILSCKNGHILCSSCWSRLSATQAKPPCVECRDIEGYSTRARALEAIMDGLVVYCSNGCGVSTSVTKAREHELICDER